MKQLIPILLCLLIFSIGCSKQHPFEKIKIKDVPYPLKLVKEKEVLLADQKEPAIFPLKNTDNFLVSLKSQEFLKFDSNLNLLSKNKIEHGEGPLECLTPVVMGGDENNIIIFDPPTQRNYIYSGDFKSRRDIKGNQRGWNPHGPNYSFTHNAYLTCYTERIKPYELFHVYLRKITGTTPKNKEIFKIKSRFVLNKKLIVFDRPFYFRMIDDHIYILKKKDYQLIKMDLDGNVLRQIECPGFKRVRFSKRQRGEWMLKFGIKPSPYMEMTIPEYVAPANWILELGEGIAVGRMEDYNPERKEWIDADYFDKDLNFLGKIKLPWFYWWNFPGEFRADFLFYSNGNKLYFIQTRETPTDEESWLVRYRVETKS